MSKRNSFSGVLREVLKSRVVLRVWELPPVTVSANVAEVLQATGGGTISTFVVTLVVTVVFVAVTEVVITVVTVVFVTGGGWAWTAGGRTSAKSASESGN